jgi:hypothetical protein
MLAAMSSRELAEWMAYEKVTGPLDDRLRADISAGIIAATVSNANGAKKKAKPSDFIPTWFKRKRSVREIWAEVVKANTALGGSYSQGRP